MTTTHSTTTATLDRFAPPPRTFAVTDWRDRYAEPPRADPRGVHAAEERALAGAMFGLCCGWFAAGPVGGLFGLCAGALLAVK